MSRKLLSLLAATCLESHNGGYLKSSNSLLFEYGPGTRRLPGTIADLHPIKAIPVIVLCATKEEIITITEYDSMAFLFL